MFNKSKKVIGTIIGYETDPENAFDQYPMVQFDDIETGETVMATADKVSLRKQPAVGSSVNLEYKKVKSWGVIAYNVKIII